MSHGVLDVTETSMNLRGQAVALDVFRAQLEDRIELDQRGGKLLVGRECLGENEPRCGVVRVAGEPVTTQRDGVAATSCLAVEIGELGEGEGRGIPRQPLLLPAD